MVPFHRSFSSPSLSQPTSISIPSPAAWCEPPAALSDSPAPCLEKLQLQQCVSLCWEGHTLLLRPVGYMRPTWQACEHALQDLKAEAIAEAHKLDQALIVSLGACVVQTMLHMRQNKSKTQLQVGEASWRGSAIRLQVRYEILPCHPATNVY